MPPILNPEKCVHCGICIEVCPEDVFLGSRKKGIPKIRYAEECWHCGACVLDCPSQAITLYIPLPMRLYKRGSGQEEALLLTHHEHRRKL